MQPDKAQQFQWKVEVDVLHTAKPVYPLIRGYLLTRSGFVGTQFLFLAPQPAPAIYLLLDEDATFNFYESRERVSILRARGSASSFHHLVIPPSAGLIIERARQRSSDKAAELTKRPSLEKASKAQG
jgi:hypothetical protein